jgi:hypothetical protein
LNMINILSDKNNHLSSKKYTSSNYSA